MAGAPRTDERRALQREGPELEQQLQGYLAEFRRGFEAVERIDRPGVAVFGSARARQDDPWWDTAVRIGEGFARAGFAVVTGGGPGMMEAANRGARRGGGLSVGFNSVLPEEQGMNDFVDVGVTFDHFYARKVMFVKASEGFVVLPGGFGTLDELYEALTLIQTGKIEHFPMVLVGRGYWEPALRWQREHLLAGRYVSRDDLGLLTLTDDPDEAVHTVVACYRRECAHETTPSASKEL